MASTNFECSLDRVESGQILVFAHDGLALPSRVYPRGERPGVSSKRYFQSVISYILPLPPPSTLSLSLFIYSSIYLSIYITSLSVSLQRQH